MKHQQLIELSEKHSCEDCANIRYFKAVIKRCDKHSNEIFNIRAQKYEYRSHSSSEYFICGDWIEQQEFKLAKGI
jgi:hypothetical protein